MHSNVNHMRCDMPILLDARARKAHAPVVHRAVLCLASEREASLQDATEGQVKKWMSTKKLTSLTPILTTYREARRVNSAASCYADCTDSSESVQSA